MQISLKDMLKAGVHFGHQPSRWNPKMKPYIFGKRAGIYIIDLEKSARKLAEALAFLQKASSEGKTILFATTKLQAIPVLEEAAKACKSPYITKRWLGGFLTNFKMIKKRIRYLLNLEERFAAGEMERYTKKERLEFGKELARLTNTLGGVKQLDALPDVIVIADIVRDHLAISEANKLHIPLVALADVDSNPELVDYPIPANDDAVKSIKYILGKLVEAIQEGKHGLPKAASQQQAKTKIGEQDMAIELTGVDVAAEEALEEDLIAEVVPAER
ncbi:MAG: 30S ribosomal protein S2 [Candidatus Abawacabacteria bacterium RIFCSPHIGHO2_01_FULL_46_8]|uniref:Small ribosomal subunit protein uS2 n=1 Tax=Candidatus Abawacabacteria bacterium RIFCSPHIGHO2_01_FULL_46_8 TaxID=1817815 RepID=A0A1F4XIY2_9BACT|nr:MAG: 30S ribosomal protein S2 [Candidatus Abawacabacteria bacterium RIFCSPHIGHO2_01_FULL_46_8]